VSTLTMYCVREDTAVPLLSTFSAFALAAAFRVMIWQFLGHLPPLTSYKFLALVLFSVLAFSVQLSQLFGIP